MTSDPVPIRFQTISRGDVLLVLPTVPDDAPEALKAAIAKRNGATLSGRCDCGATVILGRQGAIIEHEDACEASDVAIAAIVGRRLR